MRSFEERKAEILRRSGQRISVRKKNTRLISAVCLPLICIIIAIPIFSHRSSEKYGNAPMAPEEDAPMIEAEAEAEVIEISVTVNGKLFTGEEAEYIAQALEVLMKDKNSSPECEIVYPESTVGYYEIKLIEGKSYVTYILKNNVLSLNGDSEKTLTSKELTELIALFGLK